MSQLQLSRPHAELVALDVDQVDIAADLGLESRETHPRGAEAKTPLQVWHSTVKAADWADPTDVKQVFGDASILKNGRVVFNVSGNKFRLVVRINYAYRVVYVRFIGTHKEYDNIDVETV